MQFCHATPLIRNLGREEEQQWQKNKVVNLKLAVSRLDGVLLYPGETFSYWRLIGRPSRRKGYREGMVLFLGRIGGDSGGGKCRGSGEGGPCASAPDQCERQRGVGDEIADGA